MIDLYDAERIASTGLATGSTEDWIKKPSSLKWELCDYQIKEMHATASSDVAKSFLSAVYFNGGST